MKNTITTSLVCLFFSIFLISCIDDLNVSPIDEDELTSEFAYKDEESFKQVLAKLYSGFVLTGQHGPAGSGDLKGIDEGFSSFLRQYWSLQELPTDEAVVGWNDPGLPDFHNMNWGSSNPFIRGLYSRIFVQITLANDFIKNAKGRGGIIEDEFLPEARIIRALFYYFAMDLYGKVPFVTEENAIGAFLPDQTTRKDLFIYLEKELKELSDQLKAPNTNEYGRADRALAWMILAKMYLNAEVYIEEKKYTEALEQINKIIAGGYTLAEDYTYLFLNDNHQLDKTESIFLVQSDGEASQTWGGMTFLVNAPYSSEFATDYGAAGWGGLRTTKALVNKFRNGKESGELTDGRGKEIILQDYGDNEQHTEEIEDIKSYTDGLVVSKFRNLNRDGEKGTNANFPETDFIMFRLADAYLMYAEVVLRGGGGDKATAVGYINQLRQRKSNGSPIGADITENELTLDFILDERARELYWEGHRRTDLIRFKKFTTGSYLWSWKGGAKEGREVDVKYRLYPIPAADINANPKLQQNDGY